MTGGLLFRFTSPNDCDFEILKTALDNIPRDNICYKTVVYHLAAFAYKLNVQDGAFVENILKRLERIKGDFRYIQPRDCDRYHFLSTILPCHENCHATDYFLRIANERRMIVNYWSRQRIVDATVKRCHPCERAISIESPQLLFVLLKHGSGLSEHRFFFKYLIIELFDTIVCNLKILSKSIQETRDLIQCVLYILRACPSFNYSDQYEEWKTIADLVPPSLSHLIQKTSEPTSIQHLSRLTIRKQLFNNWQLPAGIEHLRLPNRLKNYLNIMEDR